MTRKYRSRQEVYEDDIDTGFRIIIVLFLVFLLFSFIAGIKYFLLTAVVEILLIILAIVVKKLYDRNRVRRNEEHKQKILLAIKNAGFEKRIDEFISSFGFSKGKKDQVWTRRNYTIDSHRIHDLKDIINKEGLNISYKDICIVLAHYIDKRELDVTSSSILALSHYKFSDLDGAMFENLLYRLYRAMGYDVRLIGRTGDQGGDLIAAKGNEKILIQAKCYQNSSVGNSAVQEASTAIKYHSCNKAVVVSTSFFTKEAMELARANQVDLIPGPILQKMLLDYLNERWS